MDHILVIFRHIMELAKIKTFRKRLVELEIYGWMPFTKVTGLYYQLVI